MKILKNIVFKCDNWDRKDWWDEGVGRNDNIAAIVYLALSLGPLIVYAKSGIGRDWLACPGWPRAGVLLYGFLVVTVGPLWWLWVEASAFFDWSAKKYTNATELKEERDRFKLHSDSARSLWASVIALYAGALLKFG
ncbi:MAG TPA: hypothetical protein VFE33_21035 [Thermoanaerobaculia bacterium]|nr:hypothetical protein [Thermoanaerobaculia bacterium]